MLAASRALNRGKVVTETLRHARPVLATLAPDGLRAHGRHAWDQRSERRSEADGPPSQRAARQALAATIGRAGLEVLAASDADEAPLWLRELPTLRVLRSVGVQHYRPTELGRRWRTERDGLPPRPGS